MKSTHMPPLGSATSSQPDLFHPETLMSAASSRSAPTTLEATPNVISSPGLVDGLKPLVSPVGDKTGRHGQAVAPVNHLALQESAKAFPTSAIFGPNGFGSSASAALQQSLENRLRQRLHGSDLCEVIWKPWVTPWGQSLSKPRVQMRTTFEIAIGLWPTLTSNSPAKGYNEAGNSAGQVAIRKILLGLWSTLRASDGAKGSPRQSFGAGGQPLPSQVWDVAKSSNAPTENGGQSLHPEFAGWEMGYRPAWLSCAPSGTPSTRDRQPNSSQPTWSAGHDN